PEITEVSVDTFSISHRRFRRITVFQMTRALRRALVYFALPQSLPCLPIYAIDHKAMLRLRNVLSLAAEIEPLLRRFDVTAAGDRGEEDAISPHDWRRPTAPWDVGFPGDIFSRAPFVGKRRIIGNAHRLRAAELWPVVIC